MFCCICWYVHTYEMVDRISKESNGVFNATLADIKTRLQCMPTTSTRVEVTNTRTQSNLKGEILVHRVESQDAISGRREVKWRQEQGMQIILLSLLLIMSILSLREICIWSWQMETYCQRSRRICISGLDRCCSKGVEIQLSKNSTFNIFKCGCCKECLTLSLPG